MADPILNPAGTHVYFYNAETGGAWWCPVGAAEAMLAHPLAQWQYAEPETGAFDGLVDEADDEGEVFDPSKRKVSEVNAHLAAHTGDPGEIARVLELEKAGQNRPGVKDPRLTTTPTGD